MTGELGVETVRGRGKEEGGLSNKQVYGYFIMALDFIYRGMWFTEGFQCSKTTVCKLFL